MISTGRKRLTEPLESVTAVFGLLMAIAVVVAVAFSVAGSHTLDIFSGNVCVAQPTVQYADSAWRMPPTLVTAKAGNSLTVSGSLLACASHATAGQTALYLLAELPLIVLWAGILIQLWRMISVARRLGPFTLAVARRMRVLGWLVIAGNAAATVLHLVGIDTLLVMMARLPSPFVNLIFLPLRELVPVPVLAGATLITVARFITAGTAMDDELKATI
jgi:hypothetical protein